MSTDEYVPSEEQVRDEWISAMTTEDPDNYWDAISDEVAHARWSAFLARVRRDAAREALDGLIADKAHMTVLLHAENGGNVEDVLTHYRDTLHPEETP